MSNDRYQLHLGDCLDVLKSLPDGSVDAVITDPPYEDEAHTMQRRGKRPTAESTERVTVVEPLDFAPMSSDLRAAVSTEIARVSRGWILTFCQAEAVAEWRDALVAGGASYRRACVWLKPDGMPQYSGDRPGMGYESIVTAWAGEGKSCWNGGGRHGVFRHNKGEQIRYGHPTQKPLSLMRELVRLFTGGEATILDPFMGSGTTGVAALQMGCKFIGCEIEPKYFKIAKRRIDAEARQRTLDFGGEA